MFSSLILALATTSIASAIIVQRGTPDVRLAVSPKCGTLSGNPADVNAGLRPLNTYETIVSFGDSYTDGGVSDGSPLKPPILSPPNPKAGGRISNGPVWVENLAMSANATLKDYAMRLAKLFICVYRIYIRLKVDGAVIDSSQYPGISLPDAHDFLYQANFFTGQGMRYDPNTTLYTIFFGIGDFEVSQGRDLSVAAQNIIYEMLVLSSSPTFAKNFLVIDNYGRGETSATGEAFKQELFSGLKALRSIYGANVAFVDFSNIWKGVLGSTPGYKAFGYTSPGACTVNSDTTVGACSDPDHTFYWIPGTPSRVTHRIMSTYVEQVLSKCKA